MIKSPIDLLQEKQIGSAKLIKYEVDEMSATLFNLRAMRDAPFTRISQGNFIKLLVNNYIMMSDTDMERRTNREFIDNANGDVLIAGLGIGLIIYNIQEKKEVKSITVVEINKDVIDLIQPHFPNIKIINEDIFNYQPKQKFDTIYFDIWPDISTDNLNDIKKLHNKFENKLNRKNSKCWMNSWLKEELQRQKRRNQWY